MKALERRLGSNTISDGNAGLGTSFTAIAHNMVQPGGRIALILPTSAMMGGSYDADDGQAYSWQRLRNLLHDHYDQIVVVSIAQPEKKNSAFSADSDFADCIIIARRIPARTRPSRRAHFVILKAAPANKLEAQETARAIKRAIAATTEIDTWNRIEIGDEEIGVVHYENTALNRKWTTVRISDPQLVGRARALAEGKLHLPQRAIPVDIPMTFVGHIATVGPVDRDITGRSNSPFNKINQYHPTDDYPMLWNHARRGEKPQHEMLTVPDSHGEVVPRREKAAQDMWERYATHLHINRGFQFNANATAAAFTERRSLGGAVWPTLTMETVQQEKALCLWLNGTLGIIGYWITSNRSQNGRGMTTVTAIPDIPVLNVTAISTEQLTATVKIFDDLQGKKMLPANEAWRDPVRQQIDKRLLIEVFGLDKRATEQMAILRHQWCRSHRRRKQGHRTKRGTPHNGVQRPFGHSAPSIQATLLLADLPLASKNRIRHRDDRIGNGHKKSGVAESPISCGNVPI